MTHLSISLALPCFNEEQNIKRTVQDVLQWFDKDTIDGEVIVVDDGSKDRSLEIVKEMQKDDDRIHVVIHEHNQGYGAAVRSGLDASTKEYIGFMDSDGQFKAEHFATLIAELHSADFVTGRKIKRADPLPRKINAKCYAGLVGLLFNVWVHDINCAMKLWKKDIWADIRPIYGLGALFNAELYVRLKKQKIVWKQVWIPHFPRQFGQQTGANLQVIVRMFKELLMLRWKMWR